MKKSTISHRNLQNSLVLLKLSHKNFANCFGIISNFISSHFQHEKSVSEFKKKI